MRHDYYKKIFDRPDGYVCIPTDLWLKFENNIINCGMLKLLVGLGLDKDKPNFPMSSNSDLGQMYSMHPTLVSNDITKAVNKGYLRATRVGRYRKYSFPKGCETKFISKEQMETIQK